MKPILSYLAAMMLSASAAVAGTPRTIYVDVDKEADILLSAVTDGIRLIPFCETQGVQIPSVARVISGKNNLIVTSEKNTDQYLFDKNGRFVSNLCHDSNIHGVQMTSDIFLCDNLHYSSMVRNKIYMYDGRSSKMYAFSKSGKKLTEESLPLQNGSRRTLFLHTATKEGWYGWEDIQVGSNLFYEYSDLSRRYSVHKLGSDTIFTVSKKTGTAAPEYIIFFPGKEYTDDLLQLNAAQLLNYPYQHPDRAGLIAGHISTANKLYFNYRYKNDIHDALYNCATDNVLYGHLICDLFDGGDVKVVGSSDKGIILAIQDPWHLKLTDKSYSVFSKKDIRILEAINSETDFILMEVKLKNF